MNSIPSLLRYRFLVLLLAVAAWLLPTSAQANTPRGFPWGQALLELHQKLQTGEQGPSALPFPLPSPPVQLDDPNPQNLGNAWFGAAPKMTVVLRNWASSTRLAGSRLGLNDSVRLSESTRMVIGRARLTGSRFVPFLQVGFGQWRVDPSVLPLTPRNEEVATQLGTGFEARLAQRVFIAVEASMTTLLREGIQNNIPENCLWSTLVASRIDL
jgi:hypothetical protein